MSTYLYLQCLDHDPPLRSTFEVGQHLSDLPDIRDMIAKRGMLAELANSNMPVHFGNSWTSTAAWFFAAHPKCRIGIRDEYGEEHSTT